MIGNFKHKGLKRYHEDDDTQGIDATLAKRIALRLDVMAVAEDIKDLDNAGWDLHKLKGKRADTWSLSVNGPWRITFLWDEETQECRDIDLEQYH